MCCFTSLIPVFGKSREVDLCEFKVSLVYMMSSRDNQSYIVRSQRKKKRKVFAYLCAHVNEHVNMCAVLEEARRGHRIFQTQVTGSFKSLEGAGS